MLLHKDRELFAAVIKAASNELGMPVPIIEKDYYVTMILRQLALNTAGCVFKGGTSLSKCHHAIDRFSEDIDITFANKLTQGERKNLKNEVIYNISKYLDIPIIDWENTRSRRDYNCYTFKYEPIEGAFPDSIITGVKMEVVLGSVAFPTVEMDVDNYVYQVLKKENEDIIEKYDLNPFRMEIQSIERTFIDKVFALCDYYLQNNINKHSRHIYDLYMLFPKIVFDETFKQLISSVRYERSKMPICPSAQPETNINIVLREFIEKGSYRNDYEVITTYFQKNKVEYDEAIKVIGAICDLNIF